MFLIVESQLYISQRFALDRYSNQSSFPKLSRSISVIKTNVLRNWYMLDLTGDCDNVISDGSVITG